MIYQSRSKRRRIVLKGNGSPLTASMHSLAGLVTEHSMDHGGLIKVVKEEISLVGCGHGLGRRGH